MTVHPKYLMSQSVVCDGTLLFAHELTETVLCAVYEYAKQQGMTAFIVDERVDTETIEPQIADKQWANCKFTCEISFYLLDEGDKKWLD